MPVRLDVTTAANTGKSDQKQQLRQHLQAERCYILDCWYAEFCQWNDLRAAGRSYVCRIRYNSDLICVQKERPLSAAARGAGVLGDRVVSLGTTSKAEARPDHAVRVVLVPTARTRRPAAARAGRPGPPPTGSSASPRTC